MKNINLTLKKNLCSGCGVCKGICPVDAIDIELNQDGFFRPKINSNCINCGKCLQACSGIDENIEKEENFYDTVFGNYKNVYSATAKDGNVVLKSSTGGVIRTLLSYYADSFDGILTLVENPQDAMKPDVKVIKTKQEALDISKSKYFATEFSKAAEFLSKNEGKYIVVGLPCQIASLKKAKFKSKIFTIEVLCGAVFSHILIQKYLHYRTPISIDFRDKLFGWQNPAITTTTKTKKTTTMAENDLFYFALRQKFCTQERCLKCSICYQGAADITCADFWGERFKYNSAGVSLVITRTNTGDDLFKRCEDIQKFQESIQEVHYSQSWFVDIHLRNKKSREMDFQESFPDNKNMPNYRANLNLDKFFDPKSLYSAKKINEAMIDYIKKNEIRKIREKYQELVNKISKSGRKNSKKTAKVLKKYKNSFLILPSATCFGSFGDQAMNLAIIDELKKKYKNPKIGIILPPHAQKTFFFEEQGHFDVKTYNIYPKDENELKEQFADICKGYKTLITIGADVLDGGFGEEFSIKYLELIKIAHDCGLKTVINGFSYDDKHFEKLEAKFREISDYTIFNLRDENSYKRFSKIVEKNVNNVADVAFLFDETKYKKSNYCENFLNNLDKNEKFIGLNIWTKELNQDLAGFFNKLSNIFFELRQEHKNINFVLIPHDTRFHKGTLSDINFLKNMANFLKKRGVEKVTFLNDLKTEAEAKAVAEKMDLIITSRMHLAIASLDKHTPTICFTSRDKFDGLYEFYKFEKHFRHKIFELDEKVMLDEIKYVLENQTVLREKIKKTNDRIKILARKNIETL